jgi:hypothetical protein
MKVKVIESFHDIHGGDLHRRDDVLEVTEDRYNEILKSGKYVVPVEQDAKPVKKVNKKG